MRPAANTESQTTLRPLSSVEIPARQSKSQQEWVSGLAAKMSVFQIRVLGFSNHLHLLTPASCYCKPWEAMVMAQVPESPPPT